MVNAGFWQHLGCEDTVDSGNVRSLPHLSSDGPLTVVQTLPALLSRCVLCVTWENIFIERLGGGHGLPSNSLEMRGYRVYTSGSPWEGCSAAQGLVFLSLANGSYSRFLSALPPSDMPFKCTLFHGV